MTTITKKSFGKTKTGVEASLYTLKSDALEFSVTDFGANIVSIITPDAEGNMADVALGFDSVTGYEKNASFFGACIGPSANRIAGASFEIDGNTYKVPVNDGPNNLHSDFELGFHKRMWDVEIDGEDVVMSLKMKDGEMGFPGNLDVKVTYSIENETGLRIDYHVDSDRPALINMTNHSYFNLKGEGNGDILDHILKIDADCFTPVVAGAIPTGEFRSVEGTALDFTSPKRIGDDIENDEEQLKLVQGFDHNYVISIYNKSLQTVATVYSPETGRVMRVNSDQPGLQFYAGNCITPEAGKGGKMYGVRSGLCLETQVFPDSIHNVGIFPDTVYGPGMIDCEAYDTTTIYDFGVELFGI